MSTIKQLQDRGWLMQKLKTFSKDRDKKTDAYLSQIGFPRLALCKYDGRQTTIIIDADGGVNYYTSGGKHFQLLDDGIFGEEFMAQGVYFAELNGEGSLSKLGDRTDAGIQTTMYTNTSKGILNPHKPAWKIFDCIELEDFLIGKSKVPFIRRFEALKQFVPTNYLAIHMECETYEHHLMFKKLVIKDGYEGVVSIAFGQLWDGSGSRKHTAFKDKDRPTADLLCVEELKGEPDGKYAEMIGRLVMVNKAGEEVCRVAPRTDHQKSCWGAYVGKIIEVKYEQIMNKKLIQPIFVTVRDDKTEAEEI